MNVGELDYELPADRIAQQPIEPRDAARLLVAIGDGVQHLRVADLPDLLLPGDVVVVNDTRVMRARVPVRRASGAVGEILLLEESSPGWWEALVRPSRRLRIGEVVDAIAGELAFELGDELGDGRRLVRPIRDGPLVDALEQCGEMPLPPYIATRLEDPERYQTTYSRRPSSAAAPTAGLHLTAGVLDRIRDVGASLERVELTVGLGTFRPVTAERVEDHVMHREQYHVEPDAWERIKSADRVVAVGTTTVRTLESVALSGALAGSTRLFITPGHDWKVVDLLMTNFHLPRSSLIAMIAAFVGPGWRHLYGIAGDAGYRFLSFGDAMLLERGNLPPLGDADRGAI